MGQTIDSDDFDRANLDLTRWSFVNPLDDGSVALTGTNTTDAYLELSVPDGPTHDPWQDQNRSVRVMQDAPDTDFAIEVKFASEPDPNEAFQLQGVIIEESSDNWLRFDVFSNGSALNIFAASTVNGSSSSKINTPINPGDATYLRISRSGDDWTYEYSGDGASWTTAVTFTHTMSVNLVGPFAANHSSGGGNNSPAYTAQVDYFFNTASPISPEDDGAEADTWSPFIHTVSTLSGMNQITINWYTDEPVIGSADFGLTTAYGMTDTEGAATYYHSNTFTGLVEGETYHFQLRASDGSNPESISQDFTVLFDPEGPDIDIWYGDPQDFGTLGNAQEFWINIMGHVSDPDGVSTLSYTLDGGSPVPLTIGPDGRRLENEGDFNIDPNWTTLTAGPHTIVVTATDGAGNQSTKTVTVNYTPGNIWPQTYTADWSTLTTDNDPLTPDPAIQTIAQVVDGKWSVDNGEIRTVEPGYDRLVGIGDYLWDDYRVKVPVTLHSTSGGFGAGLLFRWNGHTTTPVSCDQPQCGYLPLGAIGWFRSGRVEFYNTGVNENFSIALETPYWFLMEVESDPAGPIYRLKVWEVGDPEPGDWLITHQESPGSPTAGSLLLISHQADASFGTVEVTPVQGAPNVSPTANNDMATVSPGGSALINVLSNDSDPDGLLVNSSVTVVDPPLNGTILSINTTTGGITYEHDGLGSTSDSFTYTVEDNDGAVSNEATVSITVDNSSASDLVSDDFCDGILGPEWTLVVPDDLVQANFDPLSFHQPGTTDAWLELSVPAGPEHQLWESGIQAPHILQATNNTDFEIVTKLESAVNSPQYQMQGIVVKQDDLNFLRFEVYSSNDNTETLAAILQEDTNNPGTIDSSIPRSGTIGALGLSPIYLKVKRLGNMWTLSYSLPGAPNNWVDLAPFEHALTVTQVGLYGGHASGGSSPAHTAQFDYFENLADPIAAEDDCAAQSPPELAAIGTQSLDEGDSLPIGLSADDPDGDNNNLVFSTTTLPGFVSLLDNGDGTASLTVEPLAGDAGTYPITVTVTDEQNLTDDETFDLVVSAPSGPSNIVSDDFCTADINSGIWTVNEVPGGTISLTGSGTADAQLQIQVEGGASHEMHNGINAPHLLQAANDVDFTVEAKFESLLDQQYQEQGILIKEDATNFLRIEFFSTNSATVIYARSYGSNTATFLNAIPIGSNALSSPLYLRVNRSDDDWTISYSFDGSFTDGQSYGPFTRAMAVSGVGPYAGNAIGTGSPAFTCFVDYFFNTESPIDPEDNCGNTLASLSGTTDISADCGNMEVVVSLYNPGTTTVVLSETVMLDGSGGFSLIDIPPGTYDVIIHPARHLAQKKTNVLFSSSNDTDLIFSGLLPGDADGDNFVTIFDFSILSATFDEQEGESGYDERADFDCDGIITIFDFSILSSQFDQAGDIPGNE